MSIEEDAFNKKKKMFSIKGVAFVKMLNKRRVSVCVFYTRNFIEETLLKRLC